jgi:hypothetical protein
MNTIKISTKVEAFKEIQVPYFGRTSEAFFCILSKSEYGSLLGLLVSKSSPSIRRLVLESEFFASVPCTPAEFAAAFEETHYDLRAEFNSIIAAQEGGEK